MNKVVISASRRTDIPAYYADWFSTALKKGYAHYKNPYSNIPVFADLSSGNVKAFVFWSRNPQPLFKHLDYIDQNYNKKHYMHFTINGLPHDLEIRNPAIDFAVKSVEFLAKRYGPDYVQWRFDPIVFSSVSTPEFLINKFEEITSKLEGMTTRCYFSFVDLYEKTKQNFAKASMTADIEFHKPSVTQQLSFVREMLSSAKKHNITLYACAEDFLLESIPGIIKAKCVDNDIIDKLCPDESKSNYKTEPSRIGCGCIESKDIGYYDSCPHGCIYCYANRDPELALKNSRNYLKKGFPLDH